MSTFLRKPTGVSVNMTKECFFLFVCFFGDKAYISCPSSAAGEAKAFKIFIFLIVDILRHVYT